MKTLPIVRPANDNPFILLFHQSNKIVACDCHCFNNCLISKVCAQISNSLSFSQIGKRPSAAISIDVQVDKAINIKFAGLQIKTTNIQGRNLTLSKRVISAV